MKPYLFILLLFLIHISVESSPNTNNLLINKGDSLFNINEFEKAQKVYWQIFNTSNSYSQNMMLRMAIISESNDDLAEQLFLLCTLYRHHPSKELLEKIEQLSAEHHLNGYNYSDIEYFISLYKQHYDKIIIILIICSLIFCSYLIVKKVNSNKLGYRPVLFLIFCGFLYIVSNYSLIPPRAIIKTNHCLIMDEPSGGAKVIGVSSIGHRITLLGKTDIWYLVGWEGERNYIKATDLLIIPENQPYLF